MRGVIEAAIEKLHSGEFTTIQQYLEACYTNGFVGTMYGFSQDSRLLNDPEDFVY